jgi:hypothetical protein
MAPGPRISPTRAWNNGDSSSGVSTFASVRLKRIGPVAKAERLPHLKVGKYVRFDAKAVRAFLEQRCRRT